MTRPANTETDTHPARASPKPVQPAPTGPDSRKLPWRQGDILPDQASATLHPWPEQKRTDTLLVVVSHSCDILQSSEVEPTIEIMVAKRIAKEDGNLTHGKNPRRLHIVGGGQVLELRAGWRYPVSKQDLMDYRPRPQARLAGKALEELPFWLATRYRRSSFPDEFDRRLNATGLAAKMKAALKKTSDTIIAVYFRLDEGEDRDHTGEDDPYLLDITLIYRAGGDPDAAKATANSAETDIRKAFQDACWQPERKKWRSLELNSCDVISDKKMTHANSGQMQRWSQEAISYRSDPPGPTALDD